MGRLLEERGSQKTCHFVHVCGDGKSSGGYAWGFFYERICNVLEERNMLR
jgi:hypothetical protein